MNEGQEQPIPPKRIIKTGFEMLRKEGKYEDPEAYDYIIDKFLGRNKLAKDLINCLQKHLPITQNEIKVLDEASGTGALSLELAKRGYKTYTTDISQDMMSKLQTKAKEQGVNITSLLANSNNKLPFENGSFSAVVTASANRYITDLDTFLSETYRVLNKDGYFVWPILGTDIIPWKINSGLKQPTSSFALAKQMEKHGFTVQTDSIGSLFRNTLKGVPVYAIPTYSIGQKK